MMHRSLRLTPKITLPPTIRSSGSALRSMNACRIQRGALAAITNAPLQQDEGRVMDSIPERGKGDFVTLPVTDGQHPGIATHAEPVPEEYSVPGPFLKIRTLREQAFSEVVAVRDMNGGRDLRRGRPMCLKIMRRKEDKAMISRELKAYKALSKAAGDDWIIYMMRLEASLEGADEHRVEYVYFVMDMLDCDLMDVMTDWDLEVRQTHRKQWVAQIATGIAAIHAAGVIHRDLKPENILVDFRLNIRISDLGCSFVNPNGREVSGLGNYSDEVIGTWPYQAPEVLLNRGRITRERRKYSLQIDYWALGLIIFELEQDVSSPLALFDAEADLWAYVLYKPLENGGQSYWASRGYHFNPAVESLLKGLIEIHASHRFERRKIRAHEYFQHANGYNEFDNIEQRGRDLNNLPLGNDITSDRLKRAGNREVYTPIAYGPDDHTGVNYSWINPQGIWGANLETI